MKQVEKFDVSYWECYSRVIELYIGTDKKKKLYILMVKAICKIY